MGGAAWQPNESDHHPGVSVPAWRIYYDDGSTFDSTDGIPQDAPPMGFVCAVGYDESGKRYIMHGWDHYCFDAEQWWGMDWCGLIDRLMLGRVAAYKMGRTVTRSAFREIMRLADADPDFPKAA